MRLSRSRVCLGLRCVFTPQSHRGVEDAQRVLKDFLDFSVLFFAGPLRSSLFLRPLFLFRFFLLGDGNFGGDGIDEAADVEDDFGILFAVGRFVGEVVGVEEVAEAVLGLGLLAGA